MSTIDLTRQSSARAEALRLDEPDDGRRRLPMTRGECADRSLRPCPFVSCRHHLFLDVRDTGNIELNFPSLLGADSTPHLGLMPETCSLDVADRDGATLEDVGIALGITGERVRQIEVAALERVATRLRRCGVADSHDADQSVGRFENPFTDGED